MLKIYIRLKDAHKTKGEIMPGKQLLKLTLEIIPEKTIAKVDFSSKTLLPLKRVRLDIMTPA